MAPKGPGHRHTSTSHQPERNIASGAKRSGAKLDQHKQGKHCLTVDEVCRMRVQSTGKGRSPNTGFHGRMRMPYADLGVPMLCGGCATTPRSVRLNMIAAGEWG
jgi:hypothetical protein